MSGKTKRMSQVKQLLQMHIQGKAIKAIARDLSISKNTVKNYIRKYESGSLSMTEVLQQDDPCLKAQFFAGTPSYKDERYEYLKSQFDYYVKELKRVGVNRQVLWQEYKDSTDNPYSYTQFCYHLQQFKKSGKSSMNLEHLPGDKLFVDYAGKQLSYIDRTSGEVVKVQVFVACLPYSDYCFALAVPSQSVKDFIYALRCCLEFFEGVPEALVPDNLKAAVIQANRYEPKINRALEDSANHYQFTVTPARPRKPQDKGLVENQVKLIYSRVYAKLRNETFYDLKSLNEAITQKIKEHNQTRMQHKDYCREEKFIADEKHHLKPLPETAFELKYYREHKVAKNNHILLGEDKHYYSVPYTYIGAQVKVIYTRTLVKIYHKGSLIATHPRSNRKAGYSTVKEHLCSHHQYYMQRSPTYYMQRGYKYSDTLYNYIEALFKQDKHPEQLYRTCDGILNLAKKTPLNTFNKACDIALVHQNYTYRFLKQLLENKMTEFMEPKQSAPLPKHHNIRGAKAYK